MNETEYRYSSFIYYLLRHIRSLMKEVIVLRYYISQISNTNDYLEHDLLSAIYPFVEDDDLYQEICKLWFDGVNPLDDGSISSLIKKLRKNDFTNHYPYVIDYEELFK